MSTHSPFTSLCTMVLAVPGTDDQSVTIRMLAPEHLEQAAKAQQRKVLHELREMGGASVLKEFQELATGPSAMPGASDPLLLYDRVTLLEKGIIAWTYAPEITRAVCADLNDETAGFLAREILKFSKPSLFLTAAEAEAAQKNAGGPSIVH